MHNTKEKPLNPRVELLKDIGADVAGGLLFAIGIYNFASGMMFPLSGVSGIALIFYHLFGFHIGLLQVIINIPMAIISYKVLGRTFLFKSFKTIIIMAIMTDYVAPLFPVYTGERMLAALCTGVLIGLGATLIFTRNSSTGGMDFITMSLRKKKPHISLGKITFAFNMIIIVLGALLVSKDIESLIYGIVIEYLAALVIDKIMFGMNQGKVAMIVSDKKEEICVIIREQFDRSSTILEGEGAYSHENKNVIVCACSKKEMYQLRKMIKLIDPYSFFMIMDSSDVIGEGFQKE